MIKIICVGKIKESYLRDAISDYQKRINKYHKFEIIEVNDSNMKDEAIKILHYVKDNDYVVTLEIDGDMLSSTEFANKIDKLFITNSNITFIIGGSLGLNEFITDTCDELISFSTMTFPHGLFRGILLEQIYRACKINNNESYHK